MRAHAWLCAMLLAVAGAATAQSAVYRCGNEYTRTPCGEGRVVDTQGSATSAAQRAEAARVVASEKRLAEEMARDRRRAEASIKPALAGSLGPQKKAEADTKVPVKPGSKRKKSRTKVRPVGDDHDDFVAQVPKAKKPD